MLASAILTRATDILQDTTSVRWTETELLRWLNDGQREIVLLRPDASSVRQAIVLAAGAKQTIPASGIALLDVVCNMGTSGSTPGRAIRLVSREVLDAQIPDWRSMAGAVPIKHFVFDPRTPKHYDVYPPAPVGTNYVEIAFSTAPTDCANSSSAIALTDIYAGALLDYTLYRAFSKDAEYTKNPARAAAHYQAFLTSLGAKSQVDGAVSPRADAPPFNPNVPR